MDIMGQHFQSIDSIVALTVTAGLLLFGSLYYYSSINSEIKKSVPGKKSISAGPVKKPSTSTPISGSNNHSITKITSSSGIAQDSGSSEMKGYKMTSDGRKTTYFNREISEEEKTLLGDFTPRPLAPNAELADGIGAQSSSAKSASSSGSAWNSAGTWEEKNQSPWAAKRFQELLKLSTLSLIVDGKDFGSVTVSNINSVEGDALVTMTRGKKKFIYDYTISLNWKLQIGRDVATGTATVGDINAECEYEFDISCDGSNSSTSATRDNIQKYVRSKQQGLQLLIKQKLDRFLIDFKLLNS